MGVCIYIYITYQIKKCVYNKKACVYVYVGGCFDKYISAATWPPQIKIPSSAPVYDYAPTSPFNEIARENFFEIEYSHIWNWK